MWTNVPKSDGCHGAPRAGCGDLGESITMRKTVPKAMHNLVRNPLWAKRGGGDVLGLECVGSPDFCGGIHGQNVVVDLFGGTAICLIRMCLCLLCPCRIA